MGNSEKKKAITATLISIGLCTLTATMTMSAHAQDCERYQTRVDYYTDLRRNGGSTKQMTRWQRERNNYKDLYQECRRSGGNIERINRQPSPKNYADHRNEYRINTDNGTVRKLYETCNFWIREHNNRPTGDTLSLRNSACKAARSGERETGFSAPRHVEHVRTLPDCIKPNNLVDNEVSACLQGELAPYWNANPPRQSGAAQ